MFHAAGVVNDVMFIFGGTTDSTGRNGELYSFQVYSIHIIELATKSERVDGMF